MKKFALLFILCSLLIVNCDLFIGPKVDLYQQISNEVDWANAPKLTVSIEYPPAWGTSNPPQGVITPAMDIRKGYEFNIDFKPNTIYSLASWLVFRTSDLDDLAKKHGNWMEDTTLINSENIQSLAPDEVTPPAPNPAGGTFAFIINTTDPVTLIPWCDSSPRITRTDPRDIKLSSTPVSRASDIVLYFNCALDPDTVKFANNENDDGIWITAKDNTKNGKDWFYKPEYATVGGFFTVTMNITTTMPPPESLMTVTVKGIKNTLDRKEEMAKYSFSWNTSKDANVSLGSYKAVYNSGTGTIEVFYNQTNASECRVRINGVANYTIKDEIHHPADEYEYSRTISGISKPDDSGVKDGRQASGISEYEIFIELYLAGTMEGRTSFKIWNIPGIEVSSTNQAVEIKTAAELAAMKNILSGQYVLANDIVISPETFGGKWIPIGVAATPFTGNFYGNGHTVTISGGFTAGSVDVGLFGVVSGGIVRDLTVLYDEVTVNGAVKAGGIAGRIWSGAKILNCIVKGVSGAETLTLTPGSGDVSLGGIAGEVLSSFVGNCRAGLNVKIDPAYTGSLNIGGAAGYSSDSDMKDIIVSGGKISFDITAVSEYLNVGGVTGSASNLNMENCSFAGDAIGAIYDMNGINMGGIIGCYETNSDGDVYINNCKVWGNIKVEVEKHGEINIGGVLGISMYEAGKVNITNSFFEEGNITATCNTGFIQAGGFCGIFYEYVDDEKPDFILNSHKLNNCGAKAGTVTVTIKEFGTWIHVGGFTSSLFLSGETSNCFSRANVVSSGKGDDFDVSYPGNSSPYTHQVGGFTGFLANGYKLKSCYATGTVRAVHSGKRDLNVGGLVGASGGEIENCYALGNVSADKTAGADNYFTYAGGLVGMSWGKVQHSFSAGRVIAQSNVDEAYAGGIVGQGGTISNTAALGKSVTALALSGFRNAGRIYKGWALTDEGNYALNTMIIEEDDYNKIIPTTRSATPDSLNGEDGQDTLSNTFLNQAFWTTTLDFSRSVWDFSRVIRDGYPLLLNVEGQ